MRISDILNLRVKAIKKVFEVKESKTKKVKKIIIDDENFLIIQKYIKDSHLKPNDFIIFSTENNKKKPISRQQIYKTFKRVVAVLEISEGYALLNFSAHSLRKTYAINLYKKTGNIETVQKALNHEYMSTTLMYLMDYFNELNNVERQ